MAASTIDLSKVSGGSWGAATVGYYSADATNVFSTSTTAGYVGTIKIGSTGSTAYTYTSAVDSLTDAIDASTATGTWTINAGSVDSVIGSSQADKIISTGKDVTIDSGDGSDTIDGSKTTGSNTFTGKGDNISIVGGVGTDSIVTSGANAYISAGAGNDTIKVTGAKSTVAGGAGTDSILVSGDNASVDGGAEADNISVAASSDYIISASGADSITVTGSYATIEGSSNASGITFDLTSNTAESVYINGSSKADTFTNIAAAGGTINAGAGNDSITGVSGADLTINLGDGNDSVKAVTGDNASINGGAGNDTVLGINNATASVDGGEGADVLEVTKGVAYGGAGNDSITAAQGATNATIGGGDGNDVFDLTNFNGNEDVTIYDYTYGNDTVKLADAVSDSVFSSSGAIITKGGTASAYAASSNYKVTVQAKDSTTKVNVWYTSDTASLMDGSASSSALVMYSSNNDVSDTVIGGAKADSITAGNSDYVYGGAGADTINVTGKTSAVIGLAKAGGTDTVTGFSAGFDTTTNDGVYLFENSINDADISYDSTTVTAKVGSAKLELGVSTDAAYQNVLVADNTGKTYKVAVANAAGTIEATDSAMADIFVGTKSGAKAVTFASDVNDVVVDLGMTGKYGDSKYYKNITKVHGGIGNNTLIGAASTNDSLAAGDGNSTLYGGGKSSDTLVGGSSSDLFVYGAGDGNDTIQSFTLGTTSVNADQLGLYSGKLTAVTNTSGTVVLSTNSGTLKFTGSANTTQTAAADGIEFTTNGSDANVALVGQSTTQNTFVYDDSVNNYLGGKKGDKIQVASDTYDDVQIWLDGRDGKTYNGVTILDASNAQGSATLAGDAKSNTITGGAGSSSLWGGAGSVADTLVGGSGVNEFYFGKGEGNDVITTNSSTDKVMLYNVALTDIKSAAVTNGVMKISLTDGSSLSIKSYGSSSVNTFTLGADNTTYTYDSSTKEWAKA